MEYTVKQENGAAIVTIALPWTEIKEPFAKEIDTAVEHMQKNSSVKGFRKGHVPEDVAREQVSRAQVLSSVVDTQVQGAFAKAVSEKKLKAAGTPRVRVIKQAEGNDTEIEITIDLVPDVAIPKTWKKIVGDVNKEYVDKSVMVEDADVDAEIARLVESRTESKEVERAATDGDQVTVDFVVRREGTPIEGGTSTDHTLILGKKAFIPGFEEEVIGMTTGEVREFTLTFPEKYHAEDLAGQDASFEVTLKKVEERTTPVADDAFVASLGQDFKKLADLQDNIRSGMQQEKEQAQKETQKTAYLEKLSDEVDVTIPEGLRADEVNRMIAEMEQQASGSGMSFDDYLSQSGQTRETLATLWAPQADKRIISALLLEQFGEEFKAEPGSEEMEAKMNEMIQMYGGAEALKDKVDMQQMYAYTKGILRNEKVFDELAKL